MGRYPARLVAWRERGGTRDGAGTVWMTMPRGYLFALDGQEQDWEGYLLPLPVAANGDLLGARTAGGSRRARSPILRGAPLYKSRVSRIVGRPKSLFEDWRTRSPGDEHRSPVPGRGRAVAVYPPEGGAGVGGVEVARWRTEGCGEYQHKRASADDSKGAEVSDC